MTVAELWEFLRVGGLPAFLLVVVVASMQGRFVWRREHEALEARRVAERADMLERLARAERDRDEWQRAFLRVAGVAEGVVGLASPAAQPGRGVGE